MPKTNRGKALWKTPAHGRGTCPLCGATGAKLLYTAKNKKVCKSCRNK